MPPPSHTAHSPGLGLDARELSEAKKRAGKWREDAVPSSLADEQILHLYLVIVILMYDFLQESILMMPELWNIQLSNC